VFPWILFGLIAVPLVVIAFMASRRRTVTGEQLETEDAEDGAELEQEFAAAEAYEAKWREQDKERYRQERLP
jgi:ferric iron reductase protein FhuF